MTSQNFEQTLRLGKSCHTLTEHWVYSGSEHWMTISEWCSREDSLSAGHGCQWTSSGFSGRLPYLGRGTRFGKPTTYVQQTIMFQQAKTISPMYAFIRAHQSKNKHECTVLMISNAWMNEVRKLIQRQLHRVLRGASSRLVSLCTNISEIRVEVCSWTARLFHCRTLLHLRPSDASCAVTRWQHFSVRNDGRAAILKVWRHIWNPTTTIKRVFTWRTLLPNLSRSCSKRRSLLLFWRGRPITRRKQDSIAIAQ